MPQKPQKRDAFELFQSHFDQLLNPAHELVQLAQKIDWGRFEAGFDVYVDKGYRGHGYAGATNIHVAGAAYANRSRSERRRHRRRSAIEPKDLS